MRSLASAILLLVLTFTPVNGEILFVPEHYQTITQAIETASIGDTVLVAPGTYFELLDFQGKDITVASRYFDTKNFGYVRTTVLSGASYNPKRNESGTVVTFKNGESNAAKLIGFTIRDGFGTLIADQFHGGGIVCRNNSHPTISHNIIKFNNALDGGGCYFTDSDPQFLYNIVDSNNAATGGGISLDNSRTFINHCVFAFNRASEEGGAVYIYLSDNTRIYNSAFYSNKSANVGGIGCFFSYPEIGYNDFYNNSGGNFGDCMLELGDTTCCQNYNHIPADQYSNIYRDPQFRKPSSHDFMPTALSPLIDAATDTNSLCPQNGPILDIGLFEYSYLIGDCNVDNTFNLADIFFLINYIFNGGPVPLPLWSGDFNLDRRANLADVVTMINYIFKDGRAACDYLQ